MLYGKILQQIEVMELQAYGRRRCNKPCNKLRPATTRRPSKVWPTRSTVDEVCLQHDGLAVAIFSESPEFAAKFKRKVPLIHDLIFLPISTIESGVS